MIEDQEWREYVFEFEIISVKPLTIINIKLLNQAGRYLDSAIQYEQQISPSDAGAELAEMLQKPQR